MPSSRIQDDLLWGLCDDAKCSTCIARRAAADRIDALEAALDRIAMSEFTFNGPASKAWAYCTIQAREALGAAAKEATDGE